MGLGFGLDFGFDFAAIFLGLGFFNFNFFAADFKAAFFDRDFAFAGTDFFEGFFFLAISRVYHQRPGGFAEEIHRAGSKIPERTAAQCVAGGAGRDRTADLGVRSASLYPTELQPHAR